MTIPPEGGQGPVPFDPFRYGRPEPGSPAAAAYPHLFPPSGNEAAPAPSGWVPTGAPGPAAWTGPPGGPAPQNPYGAAGSWGPPPYGSPPYPGYALPSAGASNGKAVAGFVLGLVSLLLFWLTFLDLPMIVLGLVFSRIGLTNAKKGAGQRRLAIWGLVLSLVAASIVVVIVGVVGSRMGGCGDKYRQGSDQYNKCLVFLD